MEQWWKALSQQEQKLLMIAAAALAILIFYVGVWQPLTGSEQAAYNKMQQQQRTLLHVQQVGNKIASLQAAGGSKNQAGTGSINSIVNSTAKNFGIGIARMQPQQQQLQLWLDDVAFDDLLNWLQELTSNYGITIESIDFSNTDAAGMVKVRRLQISKGA
ncbi:type II secretion system protein GspM [Paraferrimonas sp. SM1919]|uniref:type II secretion system protein GspM n=1 Tax=Paraferrimonas sp. SM1919 TaxID=2662263 RepID=UPI0013D5F509|nr:type II secretion system protein M [Paraferrimonas sp. SM1919]